MRTTIHLLLPLILVGAGCKGTPHTVPPLEGSECVITVNPGIGANFTVYYEHDLSVTASKDLLSVDFVARSENLEVEAVSGSALEIEAGVRYQIVIKDPFSSPKHVLFRNTSSGDETEVVIEEYPADTPNQKYSGPGVIADHSVADGGMWLHILKGDQAKFGIMILLKES